MRIPLNFAQMTFEISYVMGIGIFTLISPHFHPTFTSVCPKYHPSFTQISPQLHPSYFTDNKRYGNGTIRIEISTPFSSSIATEPAPISSSVIFTHESKIDFDEHFIGNWSISDLRTVQVGHPMVWSVRWSGQPW